MILDLRGDQQRFIYLGALFNLLTVLTIITITIIVFLVAKMFTRFLIPCVMPQSLSLSITYDNIMPHNHSRASLKHNRCYSWPPSLHLIDVSKIQTPLPDINEDPWAHFMDQASDCSDDTDDFLINAGIVPPAPKIMLVQRAAEFRDTMSKRWKAFYSKYLRRYHRCRQQDEIKVISSYSEDSQNLMSTLPFKLVDSIKSSPERPGLSAIQPSIPAPALNIRPQTELTPKQVQLIYRAANGSHRLPRRTPSDRIERRSWTSPAVWLYSITEQSEEGNEAHSND
jgi:hypothetical protein